MDNSTYKVFNLEAELALLQECIGPKRQSTTQQVTQSAVVPTVEPTVTTAVETTTPTDDTLDEAKKRLIGGKLVKVQRHTSSERAKWRQAARKNKMARKVAAKKPAAKKALKRRMRLRARLHLNSVQPEPNQVDTVLSEAEAMIESQRSEEFNLVLKNFGELALNADLLSRGFNVFAEAYQSLELLALAADFNHVADTANERVVLLNSLAESEDPIDGDLLESQFKTIASVVMDGHELYGVISEELALEAKMSEALAAQARGERLDDATNRSLSVFLARQAAEKPVVEQRKAQWREWHQANNTQPSA